MRKLGGKRGSKKLKKKLKKTEKLAAQQQHQLDTARSQLNEERSIALHLQQQVGRDRQMVQKLMREKQRLAQLLNDARDDMKEAKSILMYKQRADEAKRNAERLGMQSQLVINQLTSDIKKEFGSYRESTRNIARNTFAKMGRRTRGGGNTRAFFGPQPPAGQMRGPTPGAPPNYNPGFNYTMNGAQAFAPGPYQHTNANARTFNQAMRSPSVSSSAGRGRGGGTFYRSGVY